MTYEDGSQINVGDKVTMAGWDFTFEVLDYRLGGSQVTIKNVTPGFVPVATSTVEARQLRPVATG